MAYVRDIKYEKSLKAKSNIDGLGGLSVNTFNISVPKHDDLRW